MVQVASVRAKGVAVGLPSPGEGCYFWRVFFLKKICLELGNSSSQTLFPEGRTAQSECCSLHST